MSHGAQEAATQHPAALGAVDVLSARSASQKYHAILAREDSLKSSFY